MCDSWDFHGSNLYDTIPLDMINNACDALEKVAKGNEKKYVRYLKSFVNSFRFVRLGKRCVIELPKDRGVPIGGPISKVTASIVLCYQEHVYHVNKNISVSRYVDDALCNSRNFCLECLDSYICASVYRKVPFELERSDTGENDVRWLDNIVKFRDGKLSFSPIGEIDTGVIPRAPNDVPYSRSVFEARIKRLLAYDGDAQKRFNFVRDEIGLWIRNG